ncbi:hypothetical protein MKW92_052981 [Papaver armeniacum]|nr:hypothetical protein MKW92_052981 [Papaver armeniacum]
MIQELFGSVRRSLVFKNGVDEGGGGSGGLVDKIINKSSRVGLFTHNQKPSVSSVLPTIRWRKGELIGCGAFGRVYMGMNLDSGELLAVKQVLIAVNSKEKAQDHIRELEEEVKLLKNLSHPNIVRYLGTAREEDTLNILLEFVPGGSISSLLGKFGSFPEAVIIMYTKQLLLGLEYLHRNGIMHRDIKGANILVDNKGCIKLADFGASKQVVELATISGAKSMKGTPYWMAPEVILQTGHSFSADIWSVGCTVIEMATGKPPWSQQYQEVAALFHIGTTKSHPPIPEHLSAEAKDFLLKCLQKEPNLRASASELLQHPFVTGEHRETHPMFRTSSVENSGGSLPSGTNLKNSIRPVAGPSLTYDDLNTVCDLDSVRCSTMFNEKFSLSAQNWGANNSDDDMCQLDDKDFDLGGPIKSALLSDDPNKSFNPMCEPTDDWLCKYDQSPEPDHEYRRIDVDADQPVGNTISPGTSEQEADFTFPCGPSASEEEDEVLTEQKIKAFLEEKALDLRKMQTPLVEEYLNTTLNVENDPNAVGNTTEDTVPVFLKLPPKSKSPSKITSKILPPAIDSANSGSPGGCNRLESQIDRFNNQSSSDIPSQVPERRGLIDHQSKPVNTSPSFSERQRKWKEELDQELERTREKMRQAGLGGKILSPNDRTSNRQKERLRFASPSK